MNKLNKIGMIAIFLILFSSFSFGLQIDSGTRYSPNESTTEYQSNNVISLDSIKINNTHIAINDRWIQLEKATSVTSYIESVDNSTGDLIIQFTFNETGSYTIDYDSSYNGVWFLDDVLLTSDSFTLSSTSSILEYAETKLEVNFTIYDSETNAVINDRNVTVELISDAASFNFTTSNGTYTLSDIVINDYNVRVNANGYEQGLSFFSIQDRTFNTVSLYLLNSSSSTDVTIQVVNELDNSPLEGYFIKVFKYSTVVSDYVNTQIIETNFNGQGVAKIKLGTEYYRFVIEDNNNNVVESTNPTYIYQTSLVIPVPVGEEILDNYEKEQGVTYTLVFNEDTNSFRYEFIDSANTASKGCLKLYKNYNNDLTYLSESCVNSASGIIIEPVEEINGTTYIAKVYIYFGSEEIYLTSESKSFKLMKIDDNNWLFYAFLITVALAIAFIWSPSIMVGILPLPSFMLTLLGLLPFNIGIMIAIQIIFIVLGLYIGGRG